MKNSYQKKKRVGAICKGILPIVLVVLGVVLTIYFRSTPPKVSRGTHRSFVPVVDTILIQETNIRTSIKAMGTVAPSREVTLIPRVSGKIVEVADAFELGGLVPKDDVVVTVDPSDYKIALRQAQGAVVSARAALKLEMGSQEVARQELEYMRQTASKKIIDVSLALRQPQLEQAEMALEMAEADLAQARLNLDRTKVTAPFNAMVTERFVNLGSNVDPQSQLVTLVATDEFWIKTALPLSEISMLNQDDLSASKVRITSQASNAEWKGQAVRLTGQLSDNTRMGMLLISVKDPLVLKQRQKSQQLMLGDFVSVEIEGKELSAVYPVPRSALRENCTVWVENDGKLEMHPVEIAWKNLDFVFISSGLSPEDKVIISDLATPAEGMAIRQASQPAGQPVVVTAQQVVEEK